MTTLSQKLSLVVVIFVLTPLMTAAKNGVNLEDTRKGMISMQEWATHSKSFDTEAQSAAPAETRKMKRISKLQERLEHFYSKRQAKRGIDNLSDSTDRWFWIGTGLWTIGLIITIIAGGMIGAAGLGICWFLLFSLGAAALIIWLVKRFG